MTTNEIYHVYNRSIANEEIFIGHKSIERALKLIRYYKYAQNLRFSYFDKLDEKKKSDYLSGHTVIPLVEIYAYSLMPNHFHLLVKQINEKGIEKFISNFQNGFAKYHNIRNERSGSLFLRSFKTTYISNDEEFLHVSRYIHLNPATSFIVDLNELKESNLTSLPAYMNEDKHDDDLIKTGLILGLMKNSEKYWKFLADQIDYQKELNKIKHLALD